ncbi:hypothetical protein PGTUg99_030639 [Puccinia graminis f. sp. tritici]|uniref:Uncharacterized protein n=1 Tax=Puccinia graminis f. sp. tritici TaxID=56615 RepID=A0A5B0RP22_PUCGR|nr:hypothetical protein PGTUg99_030639 [Puccinia graminis f. sp. tritici]
MGEIWLGAEAGSEAEVGRVGPSDCVFAAVDDYYEREPVHYRSKNTRIPHGSPNSVGSAFVPGRVGRLCIGSCTGRSWGMT